MTQSGVSNQDIQNRLQSHVGEQLKGFGASSKQFTLSPEALSPNAQPYLVFVNNATTVDLNGIVYYVLTTNPQTVLQISGPIPAQRQVGYALGGPADCDNLASYDLVIVDQNNNLVHDFGARSGHQNPQNPCADGYSIGQQ